MEIKEYGKAISELPEWWDGVDCEQSSFLITPFGELLVVHAEKAPMIYRGKTWLPVGANGSIYSGSA